MKRNVYELPNFARYGISVVVCTNSECVAGTPSGHDCGEWQDEATADAGRAADSKCEELLGGFADESSQFADWNGGKYYGTSPDINFGHVVADIYKRDEYDEDDDGEPLDDPEFGDWEWYGKDELPAEVLAEATKIVEQIADAHEAALVEAEKEYAN